MDLYTESGDSVAGEETYRMITNLNRDGKTVGLEFYNAENELVLKVSRRKVWSSDPALETGKNGLEANCYF